MEAKAIARYVRVSPRKARIVVDQIRGKDVIRAREILAFTNRAIAETVEKTLNSAVANAEHNNGALLCGRGAHAQAYPPPRQGLRRAHPQAHEPHHHHRFHPRGGIKTWVRK